MTNIQADAYVVPQFDNSASYGGVGAAVARSGAVHGMNLYDLEARSGTLSYGSVLLTKSGGGKSDYLLHATTVGSGKDVEFQNIQKAVYGALSIAAASGLESVVLPALGTGIIGYLTAEQSAKAILSAIHEFSKEGQPLKVGIVIFRDPRAFQDFSRVLRNDCFKNAQNETGQKAFDFEKWKNERSDDRIKNAKKGIFKPV